MSATIHSLHEKREMRTGSSCNPCGPGGQAYGSSSAQQMADMMGRGLPGYGGHCKYNLLPIAIDVPLDGTEVTVKLDSPIAICTESIIAVPGEVFVITADGGLFLKDLTFGNRPQWVIGQDYDIQLFGLDSECSCCLPGDCLNVGTPVSITARADNATGEGTGTLYVYIRGPSID